MSVHTFEAMGTVVSVRFGTDPSRETSRAQAMTRIHVIFDELDQRFSLYRASSEISRIARGELALADASDEMKQCYADALAWRARTNGDFTPHRPDGVLDLNGTVKALALQRSAVMLTELGFDCFSINCGGDIVVSGKPASDTWLTGISDPTNRDALLSAVSLGDQWTAIATSNDIERGDHIWSRPESDRSFTQVTVICDDIMTADVLATAIMSGGRLALDTAVATFPIAVLGVTRDGELIGNARFRELVAR